MGALKKIEELIRSNNKLAELLGAKSEEIVVEKKKPVNAFLVILAVIGGVAVIAGIAYAVYRFVGHDDYDDYDDFRDFEDDFEEDDNDPLTEE